MRTDYVRIYKSVHTWTGIVTGMALFIAFYAGALSVFKEPLTRWATPPAAARAVPLADAQRLVVRTLAAHPEVARDFTIHLRDAEHLPARMVWQVADPAADARDEPDASAARHYLARLDAAGAARVEESQPAHLADFIDDLHRVVGLPVDNDANRRLMGVVAALYALALISGVIVLLPSLVKDFFALRVGKNCKRMWLDAHNVVGIVSLPFHLVMALTSVAFAFHDDIYRVHDRLVHEGRWAGAFQRPAAPPASTPVRDAAAMLSPAELVARVNDLSPGFVADELQYQNVAGPRAVVRVWGSDPAAVSPRARGGFAALDPYSGRIVSSDFLPGRQNTPNLFISSFFALHMAAFGGSAVQWMYFLLGLAGAWLFYSGNLLWVESRRKKQSRQGGALPVQRLDTRLMAAATVGVCLGCVCGISLAVVGSKWLQALLGNANDWHRALYYGAFLASIAWAFVRGAARAAVHLLWLAAALTAAIPLTSLLARGFPALGLWAHGSPASLGVDATALIGALAFAALARATRRRVRCGAPDSVWSGKRDADRSAA